MSEPTTEKAKLRNYRVDFVIFGFVSVNLSKPVYLECGVILTNHSMKKVKLE